MRLLVCGSRDWRDGAVILFCLSKFPKDTTVITGGARGADSLAESAARELGMVVEIYPALWAKYGRAAGPIRNQQMLNDGHPDYVLAFTRDLDGSIGTRDMVRRAKLAGLAVKVIGDQGGVPNATGERVCPCGTTLSRYTTDSYCAPCRESRRDEVSA